MINSRAKGARGERMLAQVLRDWGYEARRGQQFAGGTDSPDVVAPEFPWHIEVKNTKTVQLMKWMEQSKNDSPWDKEHCVCYKPPGKPWVFVCELEPLLKRLRSYEAMDDSEIKEGSVAEEGC